MLAEYFLFLATTNHLWVQIMILILVGQLLTLRVWGRCVKISTIFEVLPELIIAKTLSASQPVKLSAS